MRLPPFNAGLIGCLALVLAGCLPREPVTQVAGWSVVDPSERHPILVHQQPATLSLPIARGAYGLSPAQRAQAVAFLDRYRATDAGRSRLLIQAPSGSANEVAAVHALAELRHLALDMGLDQTALTVETYPAGRHAQPPLRLSHLRFYAEAPKCGAWPENLADSYAGLNYANFGCANQRNFAAMVSNPADLLGPRTETPAASEKRDSQWDKYVRGESTISKKQEEERVKGLAGN